MLTTIRYANPNNNRQYLIEYGCDLLGNYVVKIRYGISLGICSVYVFASQSDQANKVDEIKLNRQRNGYVLS